MFAARTRCCDVRDSSTCEAVCPPRRIDLDSSRRLNGVGGSVLRREGAAGLGHSSCGSYRTASPATETAMRVRGEVLRALLLILLSVCLVVSLWLSIALGSWQEEIQTTTIGTGKLRLVIFIGYERIIVDLLLCNINDV